MALPNHSYRRAIEDAVVALLTADTTGVNQAYADADGVSYTPVIGRAYEWSDEPPPLAIVVSTRGLANAMLGATGMGAQWRVTLSCDTINSIPHDKDDDNADRVHGAVERYLAALTVATLNARAEISGAGITVHGKTAEEDSDEVDATRLRRTASIVLHFGV